MSKFAESFSFWGLRPPHRLPGLCPRTHRGYFVPRTSWLASVYSGPFWSNHLPKISEPPPKKKKIYETEEPEARIHRWMTLTKTIVPICLYCLNCTKFGQLILRKIIRIVATRCQILRLKCTKFDFGWGSASDPAGGAYRAPPDPLAGFKRAYFWEGGEWKRKEGIRGVGKRKEGKGKDGIVKV